MDRPSPITTATELSPAVEVSPLFRQRDADLTAMRRALISFGRSLAFFPSGGRSFPGIGDGTSGADFVERASVEELLGTLSNLWEAGAHDQSDATIEWEVEAQQLRGALLEFAERFQLFQCDCVRRPDCVHGEAERLSPRELLELVDEQWHGRSGCMQHLPTDSDVFVVERQVEENMRLLQALVPRLRVWGDALARYRQIRATRWYREVRHLSDHCIDTWMPTVHEHPVTRQALYTAREVASGAGWSRTDTDDYVNLLTEVFAAVVTHRVAGDEVWQALYDAIEPNLPMSELRLALHG